MVILLTRCTNDASTNSYSTQIQAWQEARNTELKDSTGWLALEGLFWLEPGKHSFGSSKECKYIFPKAFPALAGYLQLNETGEVILYPPDTSTYFFPEGAPLKKPLLLSPDYPGPATKLWYKESWLLYPIARFEGKAIRLIHTNSEQRLSFKGMEFYPINPKWKIPAVFEAFDSIKTLPVPTVLGSKRGEPWPGNLVFEYEGETYKLAPTSNPDDEEWFIVFGDKTNGGTTYGGGRFLYVSKPDENGQTYLDFNKAYSPPCLFSIHATCPLPPGINRLPFEIHAGEQASFGDHH